MVRSRWSSLLIAVGLCAVLSAATRAQVTDLTVTKSGNDVVLSWTTGTAPYSASLSNSNPTFVQVQTLASGISSTAFTYTGGVTNGKTLQFFQVCDTAENCVAFTYTGGAAPPPPPQIGSVSPSGALKVGDLLTINGSGFSTVPAGNLVLFPQGITAISNASPAPTETSFQVTIPRGAVSGSYRVQVGNQFSDPLSLTVYAQTGFTHVYGTSFQPVTTDIWVTDGGSASNYSKCYSMTYNAGTGVWDKTARDTATTATPKYLGGQGFDSGGYYYYGLNNSTTNGGIRRAQSNPPGAGGSYAQVSPSSGDQIQVLALATSPSFTDTYFVAYNDVTLGRKGVKELGLTIDNDYGNFGSPGPNLAPIAGLALDSSGNLYLSATTQILKITPSQSVSTVCSGFTRAEGISLYQSGSADAGTLLVVDNSTNILYSLNLNDSSPTPQPVVSGLSVPRTVAFALTPLSSSTCSSTLESTSSPSALVNTLLSFALAGEDTQPRQIAAAPLSLDPHDPACLWITKQRSDDQYPVPSIQSGDHQVVVTATVTPVPTSQKTIYFRVSDPPDSAPYGDGTHTGFWCDNKDSSATNNHAKLWDAGSSSWKDVVGVDASLTTGKASVTLNTSDRYAGDNYVVQASFDNWGGGATTPTMTETGVITNWKRIYIEKDKMFRRGGLLSRDASPGATIIYIAKDPTGTGNRIDNINLNDTIEIFDTSSTYEGAHDRACVIGLDASYSTYEMQVLLGNPDCSGGYAGLTQTYCCSVDSGSHQITFADGTRSAGVGGACDGFYEADLTAFWRAFNDPFVQFWAPPDGAGAVPFLNDAYADRWQFNWLWFAHKNQTNYIHLVGAGDNVNLGSTWRIHSVSPYERYRCSIIYVERIESLCQPGSGNCLQGQSLLLADEAVTVHELAHEFYVDSNGPSEHCQYAAWSHTGPCRMNPLNCPGVDPIQFDDDPSSWESGNGGDVFDIRFCQEGLPDV